ncbi:MAG: esterase [Muribaculaceae bacterium]|nr:esterase [Muribaculaceae bacterium]
MKRKLTFSVLAAVMTVTVFAQQNVGINYNLFNPEITADKKATFKVLAPQAENVLVWGDFQTTPLQLQKDTAGVWSATTDVLASELYTYRLIVDGLPVNDPFNPYQLRDIAGVANYFIIDGEKNHYLPHDVKHGNISKVWYHSPSSGKDRRMTVYTPAGYDDSDSKRYPVFYLLHGMGGDENAWSELGRASYILDNMIASGDAEPMIVVMPNGNANEVAAPGETPEGLYLPSGSRSRSSDNQFEASFKEIIDYVDSHYRTLTDRKHRAIAGLSMGGGHSWRISMQNPELFDYVGLFSAAAGWRGSDITPMDNEHLLSEGMMGIFNNPPALYCIGIGKDDFLMPLNDQLRKVLDDNNFKYTYHLSDGGHIWRNWRDYLSLFLPQLFK